jgi:hypothetical protein
MAFDQPNSLVWMSSDGNGPGPPSDAIYYLWGKYTGNVNAWRSHFEANAINLLAGSSYATNRGNVYGSYGGHIWEAIADMILNPPSTQLTTVPLTTAYNSSTGQWTLSWAAPAGVTQYFLKENDTKTIVDNIGWNVATNQPIGDPAHSYNWFAAKYIASQPGANATSITVSAPATAKFMLKARAGAVAGGGGGVAIGPYSAMVDSATTFSTQVDGVNTIFACPDCYFRSSADIMPGQTVEVRLRAGATSPTAAVVVLKQGTIDGQITAVQSDGFVFLPFNFVFGGQSLKVLTGSATLFEGLSSPSVGEKVAVRGLLLRSVPGGPAIVAKQVALVQ